MNKGTRRSVGLSVLLVVALLVFIRPAVATQDGADGSISLEDEWEVNNQSPGTIDVAVEPAEFKTAPNNASTYEVVVSDANRTIIAEVDTETVRFTNVTVNLETRLPRYKLTVSTSDTAVGGDVAVWPDVNGDGNPANDTTGDGLLDDLDSDGEFTIFDVQLLFIDLDRGV